MSETASSVTSSPRCGGRAAGGAASAFATSNLASTILHSVTHRILCQPETPEYYQPEDIPLPRVSFGIQTTCTPGYKSGT